MNQNFDLLLDKKTAHIYIEPPRECPMCHHLHNLIPIHIFAERCEDGIVAVIFTYHCNGCDEIFFARYNAVQNGVMLDDPELEYVIPESLAPLSLSHEIQELSPKFAEIYNQAQKAESDGLSEIFGMAYGKAVEFLVKDYLIKVQGEDASTIGPMWMNECIKKIQDERVNKLAKGTSWLRNDETHYIRKNENYDTEKLKAFIRALIHFIESDLTFLEAQKLVDGI